MTLDGLFRPRRVAVIFGVACLTSIAGCESQEDLEFVAGSEPSAATIRDTPPSEELVQSTVLEWLHCQECQSGELRAVVQLGDYALPLLTAAASLQGNDTDEAALELPETTMLGISLDDFRDSLREKHKKNASGPADLASDMTEEAYVEVYTNNLLRRYRARGIMALEAIGTVKAMAILQDAEKKQ